MSSVALTKHHLHRQTPMRDPAYFLSVSIEDFRCFGPQQTLDLSNANGGPARWTVILGESSTLTGTVATAGEMSLDM